MFLGKGKKKPTYDPRVENVAYLLVMSCWEEAGLRCLGVWEKDEWVVQKENDFVVCSKF